MYYSNSQLTLGILGCNFIMSGGTAKVLKMMSLSIFLQLTSESSENKKETRLQSERSHGGVAKKGKGCGKGGHVCHGVRQRPLRKKRAILEANFLEEFG